MPEDAESMEPRRGSGQPAGDLVGGHGTTDHNRNALLLLLQQVNYHDHPADFGPTSVVRSLV